MGIFTKKKIQQTNAARHRIRSRRRRLFLEQLEDRKLLALLTVTNTGDSALLDSGSLRSAILAANQSINVPDTIKFNIGVGGVQTIHLTSALPPITDPLIIEGTSQPGFAGTPLIELDGTSAGASSNGLNITASNTTVRSLVINNFSQNGILLSGAGNDLIVGSYIGTDVTGTLNRVTRSVES